MELAYKNGKQLRRGYTTGSCAAAAAQAAAMLLLTGEAPAKVLLRTPSGTDLHLTPEQVHWEGASAVCAIRKDSGDDPDVTNGIRIFAAVAQMESGIGGIIGEVSPHGANLIDGKARLPQSPNRPKSFHICLGKIQPSTAATLLGLRGHQLFLNIEPHRPFRQARGRTHFFHLHGRCLPLREVYHLT